MTSASETDLSNVVESFGNMTPDNQVFFALFVQGVAARIESDPEAERLPTVDLFREVIRDIAPERVDEFNRYLEVRAA